VGVAFAHGLHITPVLPHALFAVPAAHVPLAGSQQPPLHAVSVVPPHALVHVCVDVSHAFPAGQSDAAMHPQVALTQADPVAFPVQLTQFGPQPNVPCVTQALRWQQVPGPQGPSPGKPHAAAHVPSAPQVGAVPAQTAHVAPLEPQAPFTVPAAHRPVSQQPPLHAVWVAAPHVAPHVCVDVSHAIPGGHSVDAVHPHAPPPAVGSHVSPVTPVANPMTQLAQSPLLPHCVVLVPGWQVPLVAAEQQPPLHPVYCVPPQLCTHCPVVVSQARLGGQSVACVQGCGLSVGASSPASGTGASAGTSMVTSGGESSPASSVASMPLYVSGNAGASSPTYTSIAGRAASCGLPLSSEKQPASGMAARIAATAETHALMTRSLRLAASMSR
jgi:hypothetical protein